MTQKKESKRINDSSIISGIIGAILGGMLSLAGSYWATKLQLDFDREQVSINKHNHKLSINNEIGYNEKRLLIVVDNSRRALENFEDTSVIKKICNLQVSAFDERKYTLSDLFNSDTSNYLYELFDLYKYINEVSSGFHDAIRNNSKDFGPSLARAKAKSDLRWLTDRGLEALYYTVWYTSGKNLASWDVWNESNTELAIGLEEFRSRYWALALNEEGRIQDIRSLMPVFGKK